MRYKLAEDAKPQLLLLLVATVITIALWFIPFADYLVYPIRLFVTFIHESSHALVAFLTGGAVQSLTIAADGSGVVYSAPSGFLGAVLTSSAGYLGTTAFGVLLLLLIRRSVSPNKVLMACAALVAFVTVFFGILMPLFNIFSLQVGFSSLVFTIFCGALLAAGLFAVGKYASQKTANFAVAFLAVQCLLNAFLDLKTLFFINAPLIGSDLQNDATNMANATGLPGIVWVLIWIGISILMISVGLRLYAVSQKSNNTELPLKTDFSYESVGKAREIKLLFLAPFPRFVLTEFALSFITLNSLPIGARLLIRTKKDWRIAVVSRITEEKITLSVCSPSGRNYRLRRTADAEIFYDGKIPILKIEPPENWRENFSSYDTRW